MHTWFDAQLDQKSLDGIYCQYPFINYLNQGCEIRAVSKINKGDEITLKLLSFN